LSGDVYYFIKVLGNVQIPIFGPQSHSLNLLQSWIPYGQIDNNLL